MAGVTVKLEGTDRALAVYSRFDLEKHPRFTTEVLRDLGLRSVAYAKEHRFIAGGRFKQFATKGRKLGDSPPVPGILTSRTGLFRDTIGIGKATPRQVTWGPKVKYAPPHEYGLGRLPKRPVVAPTQEYIATIAGPVVNRSWHRYVQQVLR